MEGEVQRSGTTTPALTHQAGQVAQGFGAIAARAKLETASEVLAAQAKAAVQARYIVAQKNPRDWDQVRQRLLKDCERTSFAKVARYSKPVGSSNVTGLSVRFAEAALRAMGNVLPESTVIYDDPQKRIVRVTVTDLEGNVTFSKDAVLEKTVERKNLKPGQTPLGSRLNSKGERVYLVEATEDDLLTKEAAHTSKILRQHALRLLPGDIQDECEEVILATIRKRVESDPDSEKKAIIDAFDDLGIRVTDLKDYLGVQDLGTLTPKDLVGLRAVYQAIKDGETNWREVMEQRESVRGKKEQTQAGSRAAAVVDVIKNQQKPTEAASAQETPAAVTEAELGFDVKCSGADDCPCKECVGKRQVQGLVNKANQPRSRK